MTTPTESLALQIQETKLAETDALALHKTFLPFSEQAQLIKDEVYSLSVTSMDQKAEMTKAREYRLKLKNIRLDCEKTKKREKEESLRKGQAIDAIFRYILSIVEPMEEHLEKQEKFVEIQEQKRKAELKEARTKELAEFGVDPVLITSAYNLSEMNDETYAKVLDTTKQDFEAKQAAALKAEQERQAKEKADAEERERIRLENERLKKEAAERDAVIAEERKKREKVEAAAKAKKDAEEALRRAEEEKLRQAAVAPDKEKLAALAEQIAGLPLPEVSSAKAKAVIQQAIKLLSSASEYVKSQSINL